MIEQIRRLAESGFQECQRIRRHIHQNPELSFRETETRAFVADQLSAWGIEFKEGITGTGIVALIKGKNPGKKCVALRAELDALPILEQNEVDYKSKNEGVMHACGHDVHTACALGVAKILHELKDEWEGTLKIIFQPGEEKHPGGGSLMLEAGVLEDPKVNSIFALHVYPDQPAGELGFREGQYMASADEVYITIEGKGGHAALPHTTIDPIAIAAQVISSLQQVVSRAAPPIIPSVLTFGRIQGGTVGNVIPDKVEIAGTFRTMDENWRSKAHALIREITEATCEGFGARALVDIPVGYPSLWNDPALTRKARELAVTYLGSDKVKDLNLRMTADDFAFYSHKVPGCYFRLGTSRNGEEFTGTVHTPGFNIDESAMITGVGSMAWILINILGD